MNEIEIKVKELIALVEEGKALEAFDKFYADDLVMQENDTEPRIGKAANREFEEWFLNNVETVREYRSTGLLVGSNVSAIAWKVDIDHKEWGTVNMTEINLQEWKDGKIVKETFFYK
jgi:hypothetical protein